METAKYRLMYMLFKDGLLTKSAFAHFICLQIIHVFNSKG